MLDFGLIRTQNILRKVLSINIQAGLFFPGCQSANYFKLDLDIC